MNKIHLLFNSLFLLLLMSCSNIVSGLNETNVENIKNGATEIKMFVPDYQLFADNQDARVIAPQTKSVRLSYKQHTYQKDKWFVVSTISLDKSSKVELVQSAPNNFPGKIYTFTFNGLELGEYNIGDLKIDLLDSNGTVVTSGYNNTSITVLADSKSSTQFFTIPIVTNGSQGSLKSGEMKFISLAVLEGIEYTFNIETNGDYPDVVLFSQNGKFENYFVNDSKDSSLIKFTSNATEMKYLGVWADDGNDITSYNISFNHEGGTILESAVLSGNDLHWTKQNSPYYINQDTLVEHDTELIIEPGVQVFVTGSYYLKVDGSIIANGTKTDPIIFMKSIDNMGSWNGIIINSDVPLSTNNSYFYSSGNIFNYCTFVSATIPLNTEKAIYVSNCVFTNNSEGPNLPASVVVNNKLFQGIKGRYNAKIINNDIYNYHGCGGLIRNNNFYNCRIRCDNSYNTVFKYNTFDNCSFGNFDSYGSYYDFNFNNFKHCKSPIFTTTEAHDNERTINVSTNYWGEEFTQELIKNKNVGEKNLSFINDYRDNFNLKEFDYSGWFEKPIELCGNLGDKLILYDFLINGNNLSIPETNDPNLHITINIQFNTNDIAQLRIAQTMGDLEKAEWTTYSNSFNYVIDRNKNIDGFANVYVQLKDNLGNVSSVISYKLPFDIPSIDFNIRDKQIIKEDYFDCKITVKDNGYSISNSDIKISIDGVSFGSLDYDNNFTLPIKHLGNGLHTLVVTVTDRVGNVGSNQVTFNVDRQDNNSYEGTSFSSDSGEFIKDTDTCYLWHFNADGTAENDPNSKLSICNIAKGGLSNGYADYASIQSSDSNNNINPKLDNSFSIEFWTFSDNYDLTVTKTDSFQCYNRQYSYNDYCNSSIKYYYKDITNNTINNLSFEKEYINDISEKYHYWAYVYDGASFAIYCDGKLMGYKKDITQKLNTNDEKLYISLNSIDELRISKNARSPEEIAAYYNVARAKFVTQ